MFGRVVCGISQPQSPGTVKRPIQSKCPRETLLVEYLFVVSTNTLPCGMQTTTNDTWHIALQAMANVQALARKNAEFVCALIPSRVVQRGKYS